MEIRPLYDRIIVKRIDQQRQTASGIVIPDTATEKPEQGDVISVGTGRLLQDGSVRPLQVKKGERVLTKEQQQSMGGSVVININSSSGDPAEIRRAAAAGARTALGAMNGARRYG